MTFQEGCSNTIPLNRLSHTMGQITHTLRGITTKARGMKAADSLRLAEAFVISRLTYAIPYAVLKG